MDNKKYGNEFTMPEVVDIMLHIEMCTVDEACSILKHIGNTDTFYVGSTAFNAEEFLFACNEDGTQYELAENVMEVTFQGGPHGHEWFSLSFQCFLEDCISNCIVDFGTAMVSESLGVYVAT